MVVFLAIHDPVFQKYIRKLIQYLDKKKYNLSKINIGRFKYLQYFSKLIILIESIQNCVYKR